MLAYKEKGYKEKINYRENAYLSSIEYNTYERVRTYTRDAKTETC
jgi:hypothetical protein